MGRLDLARDCTIVLSSKGHAWATAAFQIELIRMGEARVRMRARAVVCKKCLCGKAFPLQLSSPEECCEGSCVTCLQVMSPAWLGRGKYKLRNRARCSKEAV